MVYIFWAYLALGVIVILITSWIGILGIAHELEEYGIYSDEDGHVHREADDEDDEPKAFLVQYCNKESLLSAFRVDSDVIPEWAVAKNIDILISPERRVVIHQQGMMTQVATGTDYITRDSSGLIRVYDAKYFEKTFKPVVYAEEVVPS